MAPVLVEPMPSPSPLLGGGGRVQGTFPFARGGEPAVGAGAVGHAVHAVGGGGECAVGAGGDVGGRFSM